MSLLKQPMGAPAKGDRMWLRWLVLALVVSGLVIAFVNLGRWQLDRLEQRRERNQVVVEHEGAAVLDYREVFDHPVAEADQWQRVQVSGRYDPQVQYVVRYRSNDERQGYEVVSLLITDDGTGLLINRGFAERPSGQDFPDTVAAPPAGPVTLTGWVRRDEVGSQSAITPSDGQLRLINSEAIAAAIGRELLSGYVGLITSDPAQQPDLEPVNPPELSEGNHFSYALQWFAFSAIAAVGLVLMIRSDVNRRRSVPPTKEST